MGKIKTWIIFLLLPGAIIQYMQWWQGINKVTEKVSSIQPVVQWIISQD